MRKNFAVVAGAGLAVCLMAGCSAESGKTTPSAAASTPLAAAKFVIPAGSGVQPGAVTYDKKLVPAGASASVASTTTDGKTKVIFQVQGLAPGHEFGAHVHTKACGAKPADSGPHYQNRKDPGSPSVDPAFANAENEVWLDFTTDERGAASASATVNWTFRQRQANAVVVHASHTSAEPGKAGTAGDRLACLNAPF
jgi:Cu-Zn family superoxide dismutase